MTASSPRPSPEEPLGPRGRRADQPCPSEQAYGDHDQPSDAGEAQDRDVDGDE
jgi:hypothetical protein